MIKRLAGLITIILALVIIDPAWAQTRFYLADQAADEEIAGLALPTTGWDFALSGAAVRQATTSVSGTASSPSPSGGLTTETNRLIRVFATDPLEAQTITGTFKGQMRQAESFGSDDRVVQIRVQVVSGDGLTVRGTLVAFNNNPLDHELAIGVLTNRTFPRGGVTTVTSVAAQAGDRILIEVGMRRYSTNGSTHLFDFRDNAASDLPEDETTTTALNSWVEFSQTLIFAGASATQDKPLLTLLGVGAPSTAPPLLVNDFATNDPARKDDNGSSASLRVTPGGSVIGTVPSGAYCVITSGQSLAALIWYWGVNCPNVGVGYMADADLEPTTPPAVIFDLDDLVQIITAVTNVRDAPAGTIVGQRAVGDQATVVGGPRYAEGVAGGHNNWWYELQGGTGPQGWSGVDRMQLVTTPPSNPLTPPTPDSTITVSTCSLTALANALDATPAGQVTKIIGPACSIPMTSTLSRSIPFGETWILDFETNNTILAQSVDNVSLTITGTFEATQTISSLGTASGKTTVTLASIPAGWAAGDIVKVFSLNNVYPEARLSGDGSAGNTNSRRMGELTSIESINTTTGVVTLTELLARQSLYTSGLRIARMRSGQLWALGLEIQGSSVNLLGQRSRFDRLIRPRFIEPRYLRSCNEFMAFHSVFEGIVYEPRFQEGRADTGNGCWAYGLKSYAGKRNEMYGTGTINNCIDHRHCMDPGGTGSAGSSDPTFYGADHYTYGHDLKADNMRSSSWGTHAEAWGHRLEDVVSTDVASSQFCVTVRGQETIIERLTCQGARGFQIGVGNDGQVGDLDVIDSDINTTVDCSGCITSDTDNRAPGAVWRYIDTTCNRAVSGLIQTINSPGC